MAYLMLSSRRFLRSIDVAGVMAASDELKFLACWLKASTIVGSVSPQEQHHTASSMIRKISSNLEFGFTFSTLDFKAFQKRISMNLGIVARHDPGSQKETSTLMIPIGTTAEQSAASMRA